MTPDELTTALGQAAAKVWGQLPAYIQHDLFEAAVRSAGKARARNWRCSFIGGIRVPPTARIPAEGCRSRIASAVEPERLAACDGQSILRVNQITTQSPTITTTVTVIMTTPRPVNSISQIVCMVS